MCSRDQTLTIDDCVLADAVAEDNGEFRQTRSPFAAVTLPLYDGS